MDENQEVRYSFTGDFSNITRAVQRVIGLLGNVSRSFRQTDTNSNLRRTERSMQSVRKSAEALRAAFVRTGKQTKSLASNMSGLAKAGNLVKKALAGITGIKLGSWLAAGIKESIAYIENLNLFKVAMGDSAKESEKFIKRMAEVFGMDPSNLYRYAGYFYQLTDAIGMTSEASAIMSLSLTKAANDVASLFNVDIETVIQNFGSGMQGMTRAVRKYGIDIRAATLQQTALAYGLSGNVQQMSEANRMALRYLTMMNQIKNATKQTVDSTEQASGIMGDFARNIETPANQLRIFKEQISQLGRAIGNFFIPILSKLLPIINGVVMALRTVLTFIAAFAGFSTSFGGISTGAEDVADAFEDVGAAAGGAAAAAKELKKSLAPFDEINLLQAPSTSGGGAGGGVDMGTLDPALLEAIQNMSLSLEDIQMKANKVRDALLEFFGFKYVDVIDPDTGEVEKKLQWFAEQFEANLISKFPQWSKTIQALFDTWSVNLEAFKNVWHALGEVVDAVKSKIKSFIDSLHLDDTFAEGITNVSTNLNNLAAWISQNSDKLADIVLMVTGVIGAFKMLSVIGTYLAPLLEMGPALAEALAPLFEVVAVIGAVVGSIILLYQNSEAFAESLRSLFEKISASIMPIAGALKDLFVQIWNSLQEVWTEHLQPMVASIGDMLAPVLNTLGLMWDTASPIVQDFIDLVNELWSTVLAPVLGAIIDTITHLMQTLQHLWEDIIGPIFKNILESLPDLYESTIKPIIKQIVDVIGGLIEIITILWNNVLLPAINWLIDVLGPTIVNIVGTIWNHVSSLVTSVGKILSGLLSVLQGIINFIAGVFTRDWDRAWTGIKQIFAGVINAIIGVFETGVNLIISLVNGLISLVWGALQSFVNSILETINTVGRWVGIDIDWHWGSPPPAIDYLSIPRVEFASGGVVTGPTNALIGEGRYDEAVIPLGNSPQMRDLVGSIVDGTNNTEQVSLLREQNSLLKQILEKTGVYLDGRELTNTVSRYQRLDARARG